MTSEQKKDKEKKLSEKEELEALLAESSDSLECLAEEAKKLAPKKAPLIFDYAEMQMSAMREAEDIVRSSASFYVGEDNINSAPYIQQKIQGDIVILSEIRRQSKTAEYAICKMLEQIEEGDMHPRTFEVLSGFQKTKLELIQAMAKRMAEMEESYKLFKEDFKKITEENTNVIEITDAESFTTGADGSVISGGGSRNFLKSIREELDRKDKEERDAKMQATLERQEMENKTLGR